MTRGKGFTLIELILVIVLMGVLAAVSLPMLMAGFNAFSQQRETASIEREAMLALDRISREVRMSRNFVFNGNSISFERDDPAVAVTIRADGTELLLEQAGTSRILASNVSNVFFSGELHKDVCYILASFHTAGIDEPWRSVTYARNDTC
jgi:prepilin-type N-terminal cleavage/methylation domain-containing protein